MNKIINFAALFYFMMSAVYAQEVIIKGTLRCINTTAASTKGAVNIIIVPSFNPQASVATTTTPEGFFQISTGWSAADLKDKNVALYIITKCKNCEKVQRVFISPDLDKKNTDPTKLYVTVKGWKVLENCKQTELEGMLSAKLLDSARKLPPENVDGKKAGSAALASGGFLNLFQNLLTAAIVGPATGLFIANLLYPGKIQYGQFLRASAMTNTDNTGFNFSPSRNISEAVFFNAAAIAKSGRKNNISLLTNFKNNVKFSAFKQISPKFYLGLGGIYTKQDEFRSVQYIGDVNPANIKTGQHTEKLQEFAAFLTPVYAVTNKLSAAVTVKSSWQQFNNPVSLDIQVDTDTTNTYTDDTTKLQRFDADISLNYSINSFLQVGLTVMNVAGTKLYADMFIKDSTNPTYINQRSYGVGICYRHERFNVGADALFTDDDFYDASLGVNYVPFNNALIAAGYAFKQKSFSVSFKLKSFKIGYIYDNDLMINDTKVGKSEFFNGKIYSGFVFNF